MVLWAPKVHAETLATRETSVPLAQLDTMVSRVFAEILAQLAILAILAEQGKLAKLDT
jgi:hypothetical protein